MKKRTAKSSSLMRLKRTMSRRDETGAGGLLPIIVIGMIVVIVAASVAASTSFAAKISRTQVDQMNVSIEATSLINGFLSSAYNNTIAANASIDGAGSYVVYHSSSVEAPKSSTEPGVTPLSSSGVPAGTSWLILDLLPESGAAQTAVFSFTPKGESVFDNILDWRGPTSIATSNFKAAPGIQGPVSLFAGESNPAATETISITGSAIAADVYADYSTEPIVLDAGTLRGSLSSKSKVMLSSTPKILGDVYSSSQIVGSADVAGNERANENNRPMLPIQTANQLNLPGQILSLTGADCSTANGLKAKLEAIDRETTVTGAELCAADSWKIDLKLKSNVIVYSSGNLTVEGLKVNGSKGNLGFVADSKLEFKDVHYKDGAYGQFLSSGDLSVIDSELSGAVSSYGVAGGTLSVANSTLLYNPVLAPLAGNCGGNSCALSSDSVHLVRVS